jgi:ABC-2 type transport system permease protein
MLKGSTLQNLQYDAIALVARMLVAMTIAVARFRRTLD